jgi:hypothetical protein
VYVVPNYLEAEPEPLRDSERTVKGEQDGGLKRLYYLQCERAGDESAIAVTTGDAPSRVRDSSFGPELSERNGPLHRSQGDLSFPV